MWPFDTEQTPQGQMQLAIQLAGMHAISCYKTSVTSENFQHSDGSLTFNFQSELLQLSQRRLRNEFRRWSLSCVLRDLIESFSIFLHRIYLELYNKGDNDALIFPIAPSSFEKEGISNQLNILEKMGIIDKRWTSLFISFNKLRNCLAHRGGIVGSADLNYGQTLLVKWLSVKLIEPDEEESGVTSGLGDLVRFKMVSGSTPLRAKEEISVKSFNLGQSVRFEIEEVMEICGTFQVGSSVFSIIVEEN